MADKIYFLLSHPIQYFSPLMKELSVNWGDRFEVLYCSDSGLKAHKDDGFGVEYKWDIPLLDGYRSQFFRNLSPKPSVSSFLGLFNPGLIYFVIKNKPKFVIIHGWGYLTHLLALILFPLFGINVWLRAETPLNQESQKTGIRHLLKRMFYNYILFSRVSRFLYIGQRNRDYFLSMGAKPDQLVFTPYALPFPEKRLTDSHSKAELKKKYGLPPDKPVILFCGKLIDKKRPALLLDASEKLSIIPHSIVFAGDGNLRREMEESASKRKLPVTFLGFKNQSELPDIYRMTDVFVLPSTLGETWGLVVNEAMSYGLPVVVSEIVGCVPDLVKEGVNGFIFKDGDVEQLSDGIKKLITNPELCKSAGEKSLNMIQNWSVQVIAENLVTAEKSA